MLRRRTPLVVTALAVALSGAAGCVSRPGPTLAVSTVLAGLHRPWDLAFTPGGGMLFSERPGPIRFRVASSGAVRTLAVPSDAVESGEGGMMGVAVDPNFTSNRRIYTCFLSNESGSLDVRLVRWRMNDAVTGLTDVQTSSRGCP